MLMFSFFNGGYQGMIDLLIDNHLTYDRGVLNKEGMLYHQIEYEIESYLSKREDISIHDFDTTEIYRVADMMESDFVKLVPTLLPPAACSFKNKVWKCGRVFLDITLE